MKKLLPLTILIVSIFYSCSNNEQTKVVSVITTDSTDIKDTVIKDTVIQKNDSLKKDSVSVQPEILLDTFSTTPADTIGGRSATFSADSVSFQKKRYLFKADYTGFSAIKINGKLIFLHAIYKGQKGDIDNDSTYLGTFGGGGYIVRIKTIISKAEGDQYANYKGTLEVSIGKYKATYSIYGGVGC